MSIPDSALRAFGLTGEPQPLAGGTTDVYRVQDAVLKRIDEDDLENNHSPELYAWIADFTTRIPQVGFRLPMPLKTIEGACITADGWTATGYLAGRLAGEEDVPACIQAAAALHLATANLPKHPRMDDNRTAWGFAHRGCWGEKPDGIQPLLQPLIDDLYALRQPIPTSPWQLIHGDLSPDNFLVEPGLPPAIIDFSPFWAPPEFALAMFANFAGPRRRKMDVLRHFETIPHFDQLLIRANIRMLLIVSALNGLNGWDEAPEKWAAEQVLRRIRGK